MSDQPQLDSLTLKDLRKLAGEHQVPNRSSLNKSELLSALSQTLRGHMQAANEERAEPAAKSKEPRPKAAPRPAHKEQEPEVLDPAAVARLAGSAAKPAAKDPAAKKPQERAEQDEQREESASGEEGEPRKRRRRRRRRRSKSGEGEQHDETENNDQSAPTAETVDESAQEATGQPASAGDRDAGKKTPKITPKAAPSEKAPSEKAPSEPAKAEQPAPSSAPIIKPVPRGPSKPRLEGQQRSLPSVLDRLQSLSSGLIELCDPDTPSWAQARLGELLAEIGVVATPCQGTPHPKFHSVTGEEAVAGVEPGHISVVEAPGFSLRGDRGDLFPLRQAQVKVAPGKQPAPESDTADQPPAAQVPTAPKIVPRKKTPEQESPSDDADDSDVADDNKAADDSDNGTVSEADAAPKPRRRNRRSRHESSEEAPPNPAAESIAEADEEAEVEMAAQEEPAPRVRPGLRHRPADEAPSLPLVPIEAEELAARAKAEGFRDLGLNEQILADLHEMGFEQPSPIQAAAIPLSLIGKDLIGQALTGTGKTAAFALPILHRLYEIEGQGPVALVLCPTRELARQVHHETTRMAGSSGARTALIYGGVPMDDQVEALSRNPHIVIGTPGRIIDHMRRGNLATARMQMVVLDEADQMLDIGFLPDITYILKHTPATRQTQLFSATMPEEIKRLGADYMREPEHIHVMPESVTVDKVDQKYIAVDPDKKTSLLAHFIETKQPEQMVVFCKTKHQTDRVARVLKAKKLSAGAIHGDLPQNKRERTLRDFREGRLTCLIATNVAARGLDIPSVSHVVNYDVPETPEEYVHRIGRTGRMGKDGIARTFLTPEDGQFVVEIEKHIGIELEEEIVEGITATTAAAAPVRSIANAPNGGSTPRLLKPIAGGIRLGRRRR